MKLVKCEVCEAEVFDSLKKCPKCGMPLKSSSSKNSVSDVLLIVGSILYTFITIYLLVTNFGSIGEGLEYLFDEGTFDAFLSLFRTIGSFLSYILACVAIWGITIYIRNEVKFLKWLSLVLIILLPVWSIIDFILYLIIGGTFDLETFFLMIYYVIGNSPFMLLYWACADKLKSNSEN